MSSVWLNAEEREGGGFPTPRARVFQAIEIRANKRLYCRAGRATKILLTIQQYLALT